MSPKPAFDVDVFPPFEGFPKEAIIFFKNLKRHNDREWFEQHKHEYEEYAKLPMQSFIASLQPHFSSFAPEFELNPKKAIFRIYRDIRFSNDKTPYKTHIAAHFVLRGKERGLVGSGYYFHIEPGEVFIGGGIYMPDSDQLKKIRSALADHGEDFLAVVGSRAFKKRFGEIKGNSLQRIPKGYDESHPMAQWLKLKQFFVGISLPESACYKESLVETIASICKDATPLIRYLNQALTR
jgi:uncharacterized protein (TIGR02453 family)